MRRLRPEPMSETASSLSHYLAVVRRQAWLIVLVAVLTPAAAALASALQETVYRASMKVVVGQGGGVFQPQFGSAVDPFATTMRNLLASDVVATQVIERENLDVTPEELLEDLNVTAKPQSSVLEVSYDSPDREQAVATLDEIGRVFTALVAEKLGGSTVTTETGEVRAPITATVFDPAHLEPDPVAPKWTRNIGFAAALGLVLGLVLAFARDSIDNRLRSRQEAEEWFGAPVIGTLPKGVRGSPPAGLAGSRRRGAEGDLDALHLLRANLEFAAAGASGPTILVTSAVPEEGKSTLVANLGVGLALAGKNVVCVEADLRRPKLNSYLAATGSSVGLVDVLERGVALQAAMREVPLEVPKLGRVRAAVGEAGIASAEKPGGRLSVIPSGTLPSDPATLLTPDAVADLVAALSDEGDYVIVDVPPLLAVADAFPFVLTSDMVIVVARQGKTTRQSAEAVRRTLQGLGANVSVVVTDADRGEGYGYGYGRRS